MKINSKSLKSEILEHAQDLQRQNDGLKAIVTATCKKAIDECCSDALEYVAELDEKLGLGISFEGYVSFTGKIPLSVISKWEDRAISGKDIKLIVDGTEVEITDIDDIEKSL